MNREIPDYADLMSIGEFVDDVLSGCFVNDDGTGHLATNKEMGRVIRPSDIYEFFGGDAGYRKIAWFNK